MISTVSCTEHGLVGIEAEWASLLADSHADPLFNSPTWLSIWWAQYQPVIGAQLDIRAVHSTGKLIGLALMHTRRVSHRIGFEGVRYELLGTAWRSKGVGFSEKTEFIFHRGNQSAAAGALVNSLVADKRWDDLVVSLTPRDGATFSAFQTLAKQCGGYLRLPDGMEAWQLSLDTGFEGVLAGLGRGTRARVFGSRARLRRAGTFRENVIGPGDLEGGWEVFSRLHQERWDRPFSEHWRQFYSSIAALQASEGVPVISILEFEGRPVSALVNFRAARREYSIASAFVPILVKRVSLGWMHLGLAIERACADGMTHFDFLGGEGKKEQYKAAFGGERSELVTLQLVRNRRLAMLYRAWDAAQAFRSLVSHSLSSR